VIRIHFPLVIIWRLLVTLSGIMAFTYLSTVAAQTSTPARLGIEPIAGERQAAERIQRHLMKLLAVQGPAVLVHRENTQGSVDAMHNPAPAVDYWVTGRVDKEVYVWVLRLGLVRAKDRQVVGEVSFRPDRRSVLVRILEREFVHS